MKNNKAMLSLLAALLFCVPASWSKSNPVFAGELEGIYIDQANTLYYMVQINNEVLFVGENPQKGFAHVFAGKIASNNPNIFFGNYFDVPKYGAEGWGETRFERISDTKIKGTSGSFKNLVLSKTTIQSVKNRLPQAKLPGWGWGERGSADVSGGWKCSNGGRYYVRQVNDLIVWFGETDFKKGEIPYYANLGVGKRSGQTLDMQFFNLHKGQVRGMGKIKIKVASGGKTLTSISGRPSDGTDGTALTWTRVNPKQKKAAPKETKPAKPAGTPEVKEDGCKLTVYYPGYSRGDKLYIKNLKSKQIQSRKLQNAKVTFNLNKNGGEYGIYRDDNPPKSDDEKPRLELLSKVKLGKNQTKTLRL